MCFSGLFIGQMATGFDVGFKQNNNNINNGYSELRYLETEKKVQSIIKLTNNYTGKHTLLTSAHKAFWKK